MKNSKRFTVSPKNKRTHVKQPGPGMKPAPKYVEYAYETKEEADAAEAAARKFAKERGLGITVTRIEDSGKTEEA